MGDIQKVEKKRMGSSWRQQSLNKAKIEQESAQGIRKKKKNRGKIKMAGGSCQGEVRKIDSVSLLEFLTF